jgi:hypothetical protein
MSEEARRGSSGLTRISVRRQAASRGLRCDAYAESSRSSGLR